MSKFEPQILFSKMEKTNDDVIFSGLDLGLGFKVCRSQSWFRKIFAVLILDELVWTTALIFVALFLAMLVLQDSANSVNTRP